MLREELVSYLDRELRVEEFRDYCPNGLQVEGKAEIRRLVTGVSATRALIEAAVDLGADAILVHHGWFWKGEAPVITGMKRVRLQLLLQHGINLVAYHLPLDAHPEWGNNTQLARLLGLRREGGFIGEGGVDIGQYGRPDSPLPAAELAERIEQILGRRPLHIAGHDRAIERIGWCSGAAQDGIEAAAALGLDAYLSGEVSERTTHQARELGIDYFACGHHATERYGVQALGKHLAGTFGLEHHYVELENPV